MSNRRALLVVLIASVVVLAVGGVPGSIARARSGYLSFSPTPALDRLSPELQLSPDATPPNPEPERYHPAVAYSSQHAEYLVVWHNTWPSGKRDIYARRVSETGEIRSWFCVTTGPENRSSPAVAYNRTNDEYLVVWMKDISGNGTRYEIWGKIIPWNGPGANSEFLIYSWPNRSFWTPSVAWNSYRNEYMVIWNAFNTTTVLPNDVAGRRVLADGSLPSGVSIITTSDYPHQSDIVYNVALDGYMVVWVRVYSSVPPSTGNDIYGAFLDHNGTVITPPGEFAIDSGGSHQQAPAVTTNEQNHYMVVWQDFDNSYTPGDWDIHGRLFYVNGNPASDEFGISPTYDDETDPDVAANGAAQQYLVAWQRATNGGTNIVARLRNDDGSLSPTIDIASWAFWDNESPAVAADIPGFLVAYEGDSSITNRHIYGRLWWPEAVYLPIILRNQ